MRATTLSHCVCIGSIVVAMIACSGTTGGGSSPIACRQKAGADTDADCAAKAGTPRKLDCDNETQTDQALTVGCVREKAGDNDVCCPTTVSGTTTPTSPGTTVQCRQKAGADAESDCAAQVGKPRKLDCDTAQQTQAAVAAGCTPTKAGDSDVCCPTTVGGVLEAPVDGGSSGSSGSSGGTCTTSYGGVWALTGSCQEPTCNVTQSGCSIAVTCGSTTTLNGTLSGSSASLTGTSRGMSLTCTAMFTSTTAFTLSCNLCSGAGSKTQ